jgi:hypothetical protein
MKPLYKKTLILTLLLITLLSTTVSAWGVAPSRQFADNKQAPQEMEVYVMNNEFKEGYFRVSFSGELAPYAKYQGELIHLTEIDDKVRVPFILDINNQLQPGKNTLTIILEEITGQTNAGLGSIVTLVAEVIVKVEVEGSFISAKIAVSPSDTNEATPITISLMNMGTETVSVFADVTIRGPSNEPLTMFSTEKKILSPSNTGKIESFWQGEKYSGTYTADVTVHYGEKFIVLKEAFSIGDNTLVSESISAVTFTLGTIVPLDIVVRNNWNTEKQNVYAELFVLAKTGAIVQSFKSSSETIPSRSKEIMQAYWDTTKLVVGEYDLHVLMHFDDKTTEQEYPVIVSMDKLSVQTPTGEVIGGTDAPPADSKFLLLILLIVVLIVVNIIGIRMIRKNAKKKEGDK